MPGSILQDEVLSDQAKDSDLIQDIDEIQAHGIGAADITKLKANGFYTVASVHGATRKTLLKIKGFSEVKVEKVKEAIQKLLVSDAPPALRQSDLFERREDKES
ncbi:Meiotic recombination protein dmc1 [Ascosphaera aggregata]|nr:Meiotic recombination protein dmc1 [Ascosphaera aggregata]